MMTSEKEDRAANWRFEAEENSPLVRILRNGEMYATWSAASGLSEVPLSLSLAVKSTLAEGAARFRVLGPSGFGGGATLVRSEECKEES